MKRRILSGWTFTRALYVVMGIFIIIQFATQQQWYGVAFGCYFASMGIFSFGCASGNCNVQTKQHTKEEIEDINFEEVKTK